MSSRSASMTARVFMAVLLGNALIALGWVIFKGGSRETGPPQEQWFRPGDFTPSAPVSAIPPKERKVVQVTRVARVKLSADQTVLNLLQLPGYAVGKGRDAETVGEVEQALETLNARLRQLLMKHWVAPAVRLPAGEREAIMTVVLDRDGRVMKRVFRKPSGNDRLDSSIVSALSVVGLVQPLPRAYGTGEYEVEVVFRVQ
ncbi:MAG: TonB C-terminal domain-containing protein [Verrucomicrobium sp.]|nr:TonB C-terminal domain-containing protein [Verrucomicrobium sp.]